MYEDNKFNSPWVRLKNISPMAWGFVLILIAAGLASIPIGFFRTFALLPLLVGGLLLYQAIYKNKY